MLELELELLDEQDGKSVRSDCARRRLAGCEAEYDR